MKKQEIIYTAIIIVLFFVTVFGLSAYGKSSRTYNKPIATIGSGKPNTFTLSQPKEAYKTWKRLKLKGRILVHFGSHLPVKQNPYEIMIPSNDPKFIGRRVDGSSFRLRNDNYITTAIFDGVIRKVYAIVPDSKWNEVKSKLLKAKYYQFDGDSFEGTLPGGTHITIGDADLLSKINEPVLINIEKDFFVSGSSGEKLYKNLKKYRIKTDCITISIDKKEEFLKFLNILDNRD